MRGVGMEGVFESSHYFSVLLGNNIYVLRG